MAVITIANVKGGCMKSTSAINLAVELHHRDYRVLLIDADSSVKSVSRWEQDRQETGQDTIPVLEKTGNLAKQLKALSHDYDAVIVDVPGFDSTEMRTALLASDVVLVPVFPSQFDVDTTTTEMRHVLDQAEEFNPDLKELVILTKVDTHPFGDEASSAREILTRHFPLATTELHERKIYRTTAADGSSVIEAGSSKARTEFRSLTDELLPHLTIN
ncbi:AAA family ATPase [Rothia koreensis]|nr:AAA family ATPase [Rothia koreensis]